MVKNIVVFGLVAAFNVFIGYYYFVRLSPSADTWFDMFMVFCLAYLTLLEFRKNFPNAFKKQVS